MAKLDKPDKVRKIITPVFRLSFPAVFEYERQMENSSGKPKYAVTAIFDTSQFSPEDKKRWQEMKAIVNEASVAAFKKPYKELPANFRKPFRDCAEKEHLQGYVAGHIFAKFSSHLRPGVVASDAKTPIEDAEAIYSGCYCRASITAYAYDNVSKGIAFGLHNVMFVKDGDRLDNRTDPEEDFGELAGVASGDDNDDLM